MKQQQRGQAAHDVANPIELLIQGLDLEVQLYPLYVMLSTVNLYSTNQPLAS